MGEWRYSSTILGLGASWRRVDSFTPLYPRGRNPQYPLDRRLDGPRSGWRGEKKSRQGIELQPFGHHLVASRYTGCRENWYWGLLLKCVDTFQFWITSEKEQRTLRMKTYASFCAHPQDLWSETWLYVEGRYAISGVCVFLTVTNTTLKLLNFPLRGTTDLWPIHCFLVANPAAAVIYVGLAS
jgi:hypothetical protein